jgi:2',3'-cyclic-nucleotide 2'-phosphodiesterase (5'-nucleotidase family)
MTGIKFTNGLIKAKDYAWLKKKYGILIALSHLGIDDDLRLADSMPQFDVILGGHSHTLIGKPVTENGVMILQAGANLKYCGKTTLTIVKGKVTGRTDEIIPMSSLRKGNAEMEALVKKCNDNEEFNRVVGSAAKPVEGAGELGSLMTDAITDSLKVDFAFQNRGGIRIYSLPAGDLSLKDVYKLDPFNNQVVVFRMNAAEIRSLICFGYKLEKEPDLQVSGMTYTITGNADHDCLNVEMSDLSGKPLDPSKDYTVAMNNYMAATYKFDHRDDGQAVQVTTAEALIGYLKNHPGLNYSGVARAKLIVQ